MAMEQTKQLLKQDFESSSVETKQFNVFAKTFTKEFKDMLKDYNVKDIKINKGHFEISGFFQTADNRIYYFNLGDVRWDKKQMLIRTAESFEDYTGGSNNFIPTDSIEKGLLQFVFKTKMGYSKTTGAGKGWKQESARHALARKGIKTGRKKR